MDILAPLLHYQLMRRAIFKVRFQLFKEAEMNKGKIKWLVSDNLRTSQIDEQNTIILDVNSGEIYSTGDIGGKIIQYLEKGNTLTQISEKIADEYDITQDQALDDSLQFVGQLEERGLVSGMG